MRHTKEVVVGRTGGLSSSRVSSAVCSSERTKLHVVNLNRRLYYYFFFLNMCFTTFNWMNFSLKFNVEVNSSCN